LIKPAAHGAGDLPEAVCETVPRSAGLTDVLAKVLSANPHNNELKATFKETLALLREQLQEQNLSLKERDYLA